MPEADINEEMRLIADFAVNSANQRYGFVLDYSEESLDVLDNVLDKIYWGFYSRDRAEGEGGLVFNTAIIWGGYLGEYMRYRWGGTWILKGTQRLISITGIEFSPISFVFERITNHPEYRAKNFIQESKNSIYTSVIHSKKSQTTPIPPLKIQTPPIPPQNSLPIPISPQDSQAVATPAQKPTATPVLSQHSQTAALPPQESRSAAEIVARDALLVPETSPKPGKRLFNADIRLVYLMGTILGILVIVTTFVIVYAFTSPGGLPLFGSSGAVTSTHTPTHQPTLLVTPTLTPTDTVLPTYTPKPTETLRPSITPSVTNTETPSLTPSETPSPTDTEPPYHSPTPKPSPTETPKPPPPPTTAPSPTSTTPPPKILGCTVNPPTVLPNSITPLTFFVHFSSPGYGMTVSKFDPSGLGENGCSAPPGGDTVSCNGSSGSVPQDTTVTVTITTPLGDCTVSYTAVQPLPN